MLNRRALLVSLTYSLLFGVASSSAADGDSWDGAWVGKWGERDSAEIRIVDGKIASYLFNGQSRDVTTKANSEKQFSFGNDKFEIVLTRISETTAEARFNSSTMGQSTALLSKR
jgi:hypothetical protein